VYQGREMCRLARAMSGERTVMAVLRIREVRAVPKQLIINSHMSEITQTLSLK
jgi:hypothetical protein